MQCFYNFDLVQQKLLLVGFTVYFQLLKSKELPCSDFQLVFQVLKFRGMQTQYNYADTVCALEFQTSSSNYLFELDWETI